MSGNGRRIETELIHAGEARIEGAVNTPVFLSAMFEFAGEESYYDLKYIRLNNTPNHAALHEKIARLEKSEAALVTASGMAAITTSLLSVLRAGDHLLVQDNLYGGTYDFVGKELGEFGISFDFIDAGDPDSWGAKLRPQTKAVYVEAMTNPLLKVGDLRAVVAMARAKGLVSIIDSTFATPINFTPIEFGFDLSAHSCTKYMNGHADLVAGSVAGSAEMIERITHRLDHLGGSLDPHACFLLQRGMMTLALRMKQQNESALRIARFLEEHDAVERVNYPGLGSHPDHARAREYFRGFSGMLSFELRGGVEAAERALKRATIPIVAPSLGGVQSLLIRPAITSHAGMTAQQRRQAGISDGLIRMSVGIEATDDLLADLDQALGARA